MVCQVNDTSDSVVDGDIGELLALFDRAEEHHFLV